MLPSPSPGSVVLLLVLSCLATAFSTHNSDVIEKAQFPKSRKFPIYSVTQDGSNQTIHKVNESVTNYLTGKEMTLVIPYLYLAIFTIGLPANALAFWVLFSKIKRLPSTIFFLNLALADLLLMLALPLKISYHLLGNDWLFGEAMCRVSSVIFYANVYSSILLLTCVAVDRYLAVVHPFFSKELRTRSFAWFLCGVSWALVLFAMLPYYVTQQSYPIAELNITTCNEFLPSTVLANYFDNYTVGLVVFGFVLPCLIIVFCYVCVIRILVLNRENYTQVIKVTLLVLLVFLMCLTPGQVFLLIQIYTNNIDFYKYFLIFQILSTFNSCIDPFIYYYASSEFRAKLKGAISTNQKGSVQVSSKTKLSMLQTNSSSQASGPVPV
eukprot:gi/632962049/ref/XP_007897095.1/ PREDICTED: proteinase-activated receptor 3-like [Callorhinchus milii]